MNSWINRRRAAVENLSRDNIFRMTSEEDALLSEGDNYWDLPRHNGRFIRVTIKRYDSGVFVYIKTFRMESGSGNDDVKWYRVNQLSVSMDELIALSALFGSLPDDQLSKEERKKRVEFESIIQKYVDPMNTRSLVPEKNQQKHVFLCRLTRTKSPRGKKLDLMTCLKTGRWQLINLKQRLL